MPDWEFSVSSIVLYCERTLHLLCKMFKIQTVMCSSYWLYITFYIILMANVLSKMIAIWRPHTVELLNNEVPIKSILCHLLIWFLQRTSSPKGLSSTLSINTAFYSLGKLIPTLLSFQPDIERKQTKSFFQRKTIPFY